MQRMKTKTKFKAGDTVIVCGKLRTTIDIVIKDPEHEDVIIYIYKDFTNKVSCAFEEDIKLYKNAKNH